jgi:disulfide bond formation protein DsbB
VVVEAVENITAVLALIAAAGAVLLLAARVLGTAVPFGQTIGRAVIAARAELTLAVAGVAMAGSLYFSESAGFVPCRLCWFQRIAMYPIAVVALIALIRRDRAARWYILPMAAIGAAISAYHVMIEQGWVNDSESCAAFGPSCADVWFESFGFVTLAMMALAGFVSIIVLNTVSFEPRRVDSPASDHSEPEEKS